MFFNFFQKIFKHEPKKAIVPHTHTNVAEFLLSFEDPEINMLRSEIIGCERANIDENINELLDYLLDKCNEEDYKWICEEIKKEYKNNNN